MKKYILLANSLLFFTVCIQPKDLSSLSSTPAIIVHPQDQAVLVGSSATFSIEATGEGLTYQWQKDGEHIPEADSSVYQMSSTAPSDDRSLYRCIVSDSVGIDTSDLAELIITYNDSFADYNGNIYHTVVLGNQEWMVENLRVTHYNDGEPILHITDYSEWASTDLGAYCFYDNDSTINKHLYGALYNWHAVESGKLAPEGWRVPSAADWDTLQAYLMINGFSNNQSVESEKIAKSMAEKIEWSTCETMGETGIGTIGKNPEENNRSGFSALPGGYRLLDGTFSYKNYAGVWWSMSELSETTAYAQDLWHHYGEMFWRPDSKKRAFSVRLLRDVVGSE